MFFQHKEYSSLQYKHIIGMAKIPQPTKQILHLFNVFNVVYTNKQKPNQFSSRAKKQAKVGHLYCNVNLLILPIQK